MNRHLAAQFFFDYSPHEKNNEVETQRRWEPLKWCRATNPNRKFIIEKKKIQIWSPTWDETLSYWQIALPVSRWRSISGISVLCRRPKCLLLKYPHIQHKYLPGMSLLRHYSFLLPIGFSHSSNYTCFTLPLHILCI